RNRQSEEGPPSDPIALHAREPDPAQGEREAGSTYVRFGAVFQRALRTCAPRAGPRLEKSPAALSASSSLFSAPLRATGDGSIARRGAENKEEDAERFDHVRQLP